MFSLGIIEEGLEDRKILSDLSLYFVSQRIESVPEDEVPLWHINEYHVDNNQIEGVLDMLKENVKTTWYCHAFSHEKLYVVFKGKWFVISLKRDETWDNMIEYGVVSARVERSYLETVPLHI